MLPERRSTSKVFQHFYAKLVKTLPMDDVVFIAELFSANISPPTSSPVMILMCIVFILSMI